MKIKTVKTITCHEVYNYGATLQELALIKFLNDSGFNTSAIKYKPFYLSSGNSLFANNKEGTLAKVLYAIKHFPRKLVNLVRVHRFNKFSKKHIPVGRKVYTNNSELKTNLPQADAYICGSDQIWNPLFKNGSDLSFYLDFVPLNKLKISYAASFATESFTDKQLSFVKQNVSKINSISVRETSGKDILDSLGLDNVEQVLDPVFLLDKAFWHNLTPPIKFKKYILVYDFDNSESIKKTALNLKSENEWEIVAINRNIQYCDRNFYLSGPETFLSLINNAEVVLTNSFHAVAFSIIFEKIFMVFNRKEALNTRMRDLLALFDMSNCLGDSIINSMEDIPKTYYPETNNTIQKSKDKSKSFLINSLSK